MTIVICEICGEVWFDPDIPVYHLCSDHNYTPEQLKRIFERALDKKLVLKRLT